MLDVDGSSRDRAGCGPRRAHRRGRSPTRSSIGELRAARLPNAESTEASPSSPLEEFLRFRVNERESRVSYLPFQRRCSPAITLREYRGSRYSALARAKISIRRGGETAS